MDEKKIVIQISKDGTLNAETFGMYGTECIDEIDKLMKDMARAGTHHKKPEVYEQKTTTSNTIKNKTGQLLPQIPC